MVNVLVSSLKTIVSKPSRFVLTTLGVVISTILLCTTSIVTASYVNQLYEKYSYFSEEKVYVIGSITEESFSRLIKNRDVGNASHVTNFLADFTSQNNDNLVPYTIQFYATTKELFSLGLPAPKFAEFNIFDNQIVKGRSWTEADEQEEANVIVLDELSANRLFKKANPIGKTLTVHNTVYRIIGVTKAIPELYSSELEGTFQNLIIYIPYSTAQEQFSYVTEQYDFVIAKTKEKKSLKDYEAMFHEAMTNESRINTMISREIVVEYMEMSFDILFSLVRVFTILALMISGFGLLNTMFFTINERISEIGIRKAVGANDFDILFQFFMESVLYIVIGTILGVLLSLVLSLAILNLIGIIIVIHVGEISLILLMIMGIGIVFSIVPALKAGRMNVIDSLKYE